MSVLLPPALSAKALSDRAKQAGSGDDAAFVVVIYDGDDEYAVVKEDLGDLGVREVGVDVDVLGVDVLAERLGAAGFASLSLSSRKRRRNAAPCN